MNEQISQVSAQKKLQVYGIFDGWPSHKNEFSTQ